MHIFFLLTEGIVRSFEPRFPDLPCCWASLEEPVGPLCLPVPPVPRESSASSHGQSCSVLSGIAVAFTFKASFFFLLNNPLFQTSDDPLQYPSGKQFLLFPPQRQQCQPAPHLPALGWGLCNSLSNFTSRGSTKLTIQVLKIRTVRPAFQRIETRKEAACLKTWYLQHPKEDAENVALCLCTVPTLILVK